MKLVYLALSLIVLFTVAVAPCPRRAEGADAAATKRDDSDDPLPKGALLRLGSLRFRHPSNVHELALSPDDKTIVTIGEELIAWDAATGKEKWRADQRTHGMDLLNSAYGIRALAFHPDGRLFTPGRGNQVIAWDVATGRDEVLAIRHAWPNNKVNRNWGMSSSKAVDVSPDGRKLAVGSASGVVICDEQGAMRFTVTNNPQAPVEVDHMNHDRLLFGGDYSSGQFSPDGKLLAVFVSEAPEQIKLLDSSTGEERLRIKLTNRVVRLAFSPDGKHIAATERDSAVRCYAVDTGKEAWSHKIELKNNAESYTSAIAYSPDGKTIAAGAAIGSDHDIYLFAAASGEVLAKMPGHGWKPWGVAFTSDSQMLYSSGWDGPIRRWDVDARRQLPLPVGVRATGVTAASPDGKTLAYEDDSGTIRLVKAADGTELRKLALPDAQYSQLAFSPDSRQLAGGGTHGDNIHVAVWNLADGRVIYRWDWPKGRDPHSDVESLAFTPDGKRLAAAVFRQSAGYLWDLETGEQLAQLKHGESYGLSFSPDGRTLATAGWDSVIRLWEAASGERRREINVEERGEKGDDLRMYTVCYAPEGGLMATAHMNSQVWIWNADDVTRRRTIGVRGNFSYGAMSFSPDGLWLATGASDGRVSIWDPYSGQMAWEPGAHQDHMYTIGFGRDARTLLTGADDGVCYLWDLNPHDEPPAKDVAQLWNDLAGDDGPAAYRAMWAMSQASHESVPLIAEKLRPVETLIDLDRPDEGVGPGEFRRRKRLKQILVDKEPAVERHVTARRALSVLAQCNVPAAVQVLKELAERDPDGDLGRLARSALRRTRSEEGN